ncbi:MULTISPECIES: PucR family transcriptional regulator [unclassified Rhodococcus (in: high G+C Gram-positive bacteria)]|uniref:PucR family transcriptional regulator n=1 Tax=unclassified Rhodococcus (in: high G+C Gram-positive bacteria) TaxID=192944 RepID=UPI0016396CEF|nr:MULTISPECIES: PucR family transcriptional regulator [unclassified Rhodococcus (in: high G+C Gram-positive bacteria)]MBC2640831.1 PucR family transcriptional regulator ligand-binding domain-containing protein [Rhodococcus sp. 3A]MBC2894425.1 PucR family transcriptional regulator ligand-binding domain-containing protein [Rhodococcus sp. 4CII]
MQPTIADVLALPVVQAGEPEIIGGGDSLDKPVRWVHVSDLTDLADLLSGGELVLTTGQPLTHHPVAYLEGLAAAGAAGLIVELRVHVDTLPTEVTDAADRLDLPVIALHRQIRFVEVTEEVHRSIVAEQYDEVAFARHAHEVFTDLSMRRATLSEIVDATADMLDTSMVLEDLNRQVLAFTARGTSASALLGDWERRSRLTPVVQQTAIGGPQAWTTTPVGPHRQEWGRLVVPCTVASAGRARMTLERAAQALALHRMVEQDRTALEQQAQSGLVDELRRGRIPDEAEATARAHALGLRPGLTYLPMTVRTNETPSADQVLAQRHQVRVLDAVRHAVHTSRQTALAATPRTGRIDLLLSQPAATTITDALHTVSSQIRAALGRIDGVGDCTIGVGSESTRLLDAARGLAESAHVADVALALPPGNKPFHRAADIRLRGLVALIRTDPRVQAFAETELRGILEHRALHGDESYDILRQFLELGGNKTELAKQLHLSRPTLYSKLATIERLLGVDLDDAESRTSLHTAVLIADSVANPRAHGRTDDGGPPSSIGVQ